ncbi:Type II restriction modification system cytosine-5 DNA methyltransferase [Mycoplasma yeatsii 13926]|uniref:Cytosine-specific methyltransferase n=1 Tax=Mycoplasma yeatsii 13926 TaxID=1188240 RepID=S6G966_9MOLU|nr:DNA cytosine methyltransferase [Mycoplasma yeatsii]EOA07595.1 Type II restriction modification system cytosine-5 DNA methyltransferase [Mycoplasma yeatsii 13926]
MINIKDKQLKNIKFIDLFAGLGGFRLALESLGAKCVYSNEKDKHVKAVYQNNFNDYPDNDITLVDEASVPDHDILCAGFPCQAFSISGKQKGFNDTRGTLFFDVARIAKEKKPKVIFLENVKNFAFHDNGKTLQVVKDTLDELGYDFYSDVLNSLDFGVPQKRERIYIVCFRKDLNINSFNFPKPFKLNKFVEDILLEDKETENLVIKRSDLALKNEISNTNSVKSVRIGTVGKGGQGERIYSVKGTAITLSANGGGVFSKTGGYLVNGKTRKLHPRECARLMGYPDWYKIDSSFNQAYKQFGNSVVVDVLQYITINIAKALNHEYNFI